MSNPGTAGTRQCLRRPMAKTDYSWRPTAFRWTFIVGVLLAACPAREAASTPPVEIRVPKDQLMERPASTNPITSDRHPPESLGAGRTTLRITGTLADLKETYGVDDFNEFDIDSEIDPGLVLPTGLGKREYLIKEDDNAFIRAMRASNAEPDVELQAPSSTEAPNADQEESKIAKNPWTVRDAPPEEIQQIERKLAAPISLVQESEKKVGSTPTDDTDSAEEYDAEEMADEEKSDRDAVVSTTSSTTTQVPAVIRAEVIQPHNPIEDAKHESPPATTTENTASAAELTTTIAPTLAAANVTDGAGQDPNGNTDSSTTTSTTCTTSSASPSYSSTTATLMTVGLAAASFVIGIPTEL